MSKQFELTLSTESTPSLRPLQTSFNMKACLIFIAALCALAVATPAYVCVFVRFCWFGLRSARRRRCGCGCSGHRARVSHGVADVVDAVSGRPAPRRRRWAVLLRDCAHRVVCGLPRTRRWHIGARTRGGLETSLERGEKSPTSHCPGRVFERRGRVVAHWPCCSCRPHGVTAHCVARRNLFFRLFAY